MADGLNKKRPPDTEASPFPRATRAGRRGMSAGGTFSVAVGDPEPRNAGAVAPARAAIPAKEAVPADPIVSTASAEAGAAAPAGTSEAVHKDVKAEKARLRPLCMATRDRVRGEERQAAEAAMMDALFRLPVWDRVDVICGYVSTKGEIDLLPLWRHAAALGKQYALPCTVSGRSEGKMIFRAVQGYDPGALAAGRFGIPEPGRDCPILEDADLDGALMIVPGLSFDESGHRIGYGGGYYDRFLAGCRARGVKILTVGLVPEDCMAVSLPHEDFDVPVDLVLTGKRLVVTHGRRI